MSLSLDIWSTLFSTHFFRPGKLCVVSTPKATAIETCSRHAEHGSITLGEMQGANQRPADPLRVFLY